MRRGNDRQANLPSKVCPVCGRGFVWRKKWERDWDRVVYCSKGCAAASKRQRGPGADTGSDTDAGGGKR